MASNSRHNGMLELMVDAQIIVAAVVPTNTSQGRIVPRVVPLQQ